MDSWFWVNCHNLYNCQSLSLSETLHTKLFIQKSKSARQIAKLEKYYRKDSSYSLLLFAKSDLVCLLCNMDLKGEQLAVDKWTGRLFFWPPATFLKGVEDNMCRSIIKMWFKVQRDISPALSSVLEIHSKSAEHRTR